MCARKGERKRLYLGNYRMSGTKERKKVTFLDRERELGDKEG